MIYSCNSCDTEFEVYCSGKIAFCPVCGSDDFVESELEEEADDFFDFEDKDEEY